VPVDMHWALGYRDISYHHCGLIESDIDSFKEEIEKIHSLLDHGQLLYIIYNFHEVFGARQAL